MKIKIVNELITINDYLRWGYTQFNASPLYYGHGTDNAWDEVFQLVLSSLHLPFDIDKDLLNTRLTLLERQQLFNAITKRIEERKPMAYITQQAWFAGLPFYVDERVIIPRSPIAELIENGFSPWLQASEFPRILDLCTGSGCIAIACALSFPESEVYGVDISKDALEIAQKNAQMHHASDVFFIESDLFSALSRETKFDLIISNPPYVSQKEYESLPDEYHHEPKMALEAGEDGLYIVRKILQEAIHYLAPKGILIVEVGNSAETLMEAYPEIPFLWLEFERGGEGVFLLTYDQLLNYTTN